MVLVWIICMLETFINNEQQRQRRQRNLKLLTENNVYQIPDQIFCSNFCVIVQILDFINASCMPTYKYQIPCLQFLINYPFSSLYLQVQQYSIIYIKSSIWMVTRVRTKYLIWNLIHIVFCAQFKDDNFTAM